MKRQGPVCCLVSCVVPGQCFWLPVLGVRLLWYGLLGSGFIAPRSAKWAEWSHPEQMIEPCGSGRNGPRSLWFWASPVGGPRNEPPVPTHHGQQGAGCSWCIMNHSVAGICLWWTHVLQVRIGAILTVARGPS